MGIHICECGRLHIDSLDSSLYGWLVQDPMNRLLVTVCDNCGRKEQETAEYYTQESWVLNRSEYEGPEKNKSKKIVYLISEGIPVYTTEGELITHEFSPNDDIDIPRLMSEISARYKTEKEFLSVVGYLQQRGFKYLAESPSLRPDLK